MKKRDFKDWKFEDINQEFGYVRHYKKNELMEKWLNAENPITQVERDELSFLSEQLLFNADIWNEDELKFMFLGPLLSLVRFNTENYKVFTQRKLSAIIDDWEVSGIADFFVSSGIQTPKHPYFFIHEYKQEKRRENDPLGQLLAEMLVTQQLNGNDSPLYGCYVIGRFHFFVLMEGKNYIVSDGIVASSEDIFQIFKMMRFVKHEIDKNFE